MAEIVVKVPDELPLQGLIARINDLIAEEHLKWMLFSKSTEALALKDEDIRTFQEMRDLAWTEKKKEFGV